MRLAILSLLLLVPFFCAAQSSGSVYLEDSSIKVFAYGSQRTLAWAGGFHAPQFAQADLNNDGLKDLVVFEAYDGLIRTFINKGNATAAQYIYAPEYAKNFPPCYDYLKLEDYNRDGVPDLFHKGIGGFAAYKGYYNAQNQLCFTFFKELRYDSPFVGNVNAYSQSSDIPAIADVDGDGDLDFFGYNVTGGLVTFYKNCQVELGLPKDSIHICIPSNCWGHTLQAYYRTYLLGLVPSPGSPYCDDFGTFSCKMVDGQQMAKETRHQGNCMLVFDYDGDGDMDMMDGNISYPDIQLLINGRKQFGSSTDSMVSQDTLWQSGGKQLFLYQWPAAFYVDADGDGKRDLLISPHDPTAGENYKSVVFYKNTGTATAPNFTYQNDTFLVDRSISVGTGAYPVLYDYNRDGRPDLFVGSDGYFTPGGTLRSKISYYQNSVVNGVTRFTLITPDFLGISAQNFSGASLAFGDLNGDGLDDMVIGHTDGTLSYYKNGAAGNNVQPQWTLNQVMLKGSLNDTIDAGYYSTPYIYDINKDGKPDLLIGNQAGRIVYYQNNPSTVGPVLSLGATMLGGIEVVPGNPVAGFSSLWIGKMDNSGTEYLVSGNGAGNLVRYSGFQTGNVTAPYTRVDSFYNHIDVGQRSSPAIGDVDGDGKQDLIIGNRLGGLSLYRLGAPASGPGTGPIAAQGCMMYPNPAQSQVIVTWDDSFAAGDAPLRVTLLNALGQTVRRSEGAASRKAAVLDISGLAEGIYTCRVEAPGVQQALKLNVMR